MAKLQNSILNILSALPKVAGVKMTRSVKEGKGYKETQVDRETVDVNDNVMINVPASSSIEQVVGNVNSILAVKGLALAPKPIPQNTSANWEKVEGLPVTKVSGTTKDGKNYVFFKAWVSDASTTTAGF